VVQKSDTPVLILRYLR